jgi:hypothetical protein
VQAPIIQLSHVADVTVRDLTLARPQAAAEANFLVARGASRVNCAWVEPSRRNNGKCMPAREFAAGISL